MERNNVRTNIESKRKAKKETEKKLERRGWIINLARVYPFLKFIIFALIFTCLLIYSLKHFNLENLKSVSNILLLCIMWLPLVNSFKNALLFIYCIIKVGTHKKALDLSKHVITCNGTPGAGKTSSTVFDAVCMAYKQWRELKFKHWLNMGLKRSILKSSDKNKIKEYNDVEEAYSFWKESKAIPCLMSNTPIKAKGRYVARLTMEYIRQEKKIPYMTVLFFDEVGNELGNEKSNKKGELITTSEFFRYCRHFGEFHILSCEQDAGNIFINMRRVVAENRYMLEQKAMLKPTVLKFIFNVLKSIFLFFNAEHHAKVFARFMYNFGKFINACGYRYYKYRTTGNMEAKINQKGKKGSFVLPAPLNCEYDERSWRNEYKAKDKPLDLTIFESLIM